MYDLDNFLGKFGYEALERRHDAPGDVFEHQKTELEGKTVGTFMYRVQGFPPDAISQKQAQQERQPQEETSNGPEALSVTTIRLEGDPERVAEDLIRDSLPKTQLNEIDISDQAGLARSICSRN